MSCRCVSPEEALGALLRGSTALRRCPEHEETEPGVVSINTPLNGLHGLLGGSPQGDLLATLAAHLSDDGPTAA